MHKPYGWISAVPSIGAGEQLPPPQRKLELINSALTECAYRWRCYCLLVLQARPINPSVVDRFQYLFPMCNTESDPHCVLIGSKLAGLLTAKCYIGSGFQSLIILYNQSAMCACVMHALGIGPSQQRWSPVAVSSASDKDHDDDLPLKKLCVFLYMLLNTPECAPEHLNFLGEHPTRPPPPQSEVCTAGWPCFLL